MKQLKMRYYHTPKNMIQTKKNFPKQAAMKATLKTAIQFIKKSSFILQYLPVENSDLTVPP